MVNWAGVRDLTGRDEEDEEVDEVVLDDFLWSAVGASKR